MGGNLPYFVKDNKKRVDRIFAMSDNPEIATIVKVGDRDYLLKDLIGECRIEPTEDGRIYVHPDHGKNELAENLDFARWRAETFGEEAILLPNPNNAKSADSFNITRGVCEEYKRSSTPTKSSIDNLLKKGASQADYIILEPCEDIKLGVLESGIRGRVNQTKIKVIRLKIGDYEAFYTRKQILAPDGFKIRPEDFLKESAFRNEVHRANAQITDAKLQKFFGLNKKSTQDIAIERHAKRDTAAIQQAWNERRIANIQKAITNGSLPERLQVYGVASTLPLPCRDGSQDPGGDGRRHHKDTGWRACRREQC